MEGKCILFIIGAIAFSYLFEKNPFMAIIVGILVVGGYLHHKRKKNPKYSRNSGIDQGGHFASSNPNSQIDHTIQMTQSLVQNNQILLALMMDTLAARGVEPVFQEEWIPNNIGNTVLPTLLESTGSDEFKSDLLKTKKHECVSIEGVFEDEFY